MGSLTSILAFYEFLLFYFHSSFSPYHEFILTNINCYWLKSEVWDPKMSQFPPIIPTFILYTFTLFTPPSPPSLLTSPLASSVFILSRKPCRVKDIRFLHYEHNLLVTTTSSSHKSSLKSSAVYLLLTWRERGGESEGKKRGGERERE